MLLKIGGTSLNFLPGGEVRAKLGEQPESPVERAQWEDGVFSGSFASRIQTPDAAAYDHKVTLSLTLRGKVLNGSAMAIGTDRTALSGDNVLAHWLELKKQ